MNDNQSFAAVTYGVTVGAGGVAERTKPTRATPGANGGDSKVEGNGTRRLRQYGGNGSPSGKAAA